LSELALLRSARSFEATDPRRSLALTREHLRHFGASQLAQEREAIAVAALVNAGRRAAAEARARRFFAQYPRSPLRDRVEASLRTLE
jgi:hypothetical protein